MQVGFRLEDSLLKKIDDEAKDENRNRSNMVETLLIEALEARKKKRSDKKD